MVESTMTGRVKTRLEPGGGAVEDWRSGGRMTSESVTTDDSGRLECWTWSPLTWRLEGGAAEAGEAERAGSRQRRRVARLERWPMGSWGNRGADGDGRSAERRRGCRLVSGDW
ncbi:hypothetical protein HAX54_004172 [Datura stramonium]|uniref:Uncharacterized protein n=1 Tax=Datura stramonium TaxID=4076 RepID=A0ABS8RTN3_DATST|nr:hypothetical protein [Datura stramonium]